MRGAGLLARLALPALGLLACEAARQPYAWSAQRYDPDRACLEASGVVDVLSGPDPGPCDAARCWTSPSGEIYVTTTACEAPPDFTEGTEDPEGSPCAAALAALASGASCG